MTNTNSHIEKAFVQIKECFENNGKLLICGNGGSSADCDHIVGELAKGFEKKRTLNEVDKNKFLNIDLKFNTNFADKLQYGLPVFSLTSHSALMTAIINDIGSDYIFAQQVWALGKPGDVLLSISTSGNSKNIINACLVARSKKLKSIGLTGSNEGKLDSVCDLIIKSKEKSVAKIQEEHIKIYHNLCRKLEKYFFN